MTISSQAPCFEARRKSGVVLIHTQLASSYANAPQQLALSPSTVGFITRDFHALISRQHSQTNRRGLHMLFQTSTSRCMQNIYLPHKTCCPDPVASAAAIPDEANCSWLHQSHHCEYIEVECASCSASPYIAPMVLWSVWACLDSHWLVGFIENIRI